MGMNMGMGMGCTSSSSGHHTLLEAFTALWASNDIFSHSSFSLDDALLNISANSEWDDVLDLWVHTYTIEYKPKSPVDHVPFGLAASDLIGALANGLPYCGCSPSVSIDDIVYEYVRTCLSPPPSIRRSELCTILGQPLPYLGQVFAKPWP
jgi:hypothetical protein